MRILVVDDTLANLAAAQDAAYSFSEHDFVFMKTAAEARAKLSNFDALVTDCFFPNEDDPALTEMMNAMEEDLPPNDRYRYPHKKYGKECDAVTQIWPDLQSCKNRSFPGYQPYGIQLLLDARELGKRQVLVTDLHRHNLRSNSDEVKSRCDPTAINVDGWLLLLPLVKAGILTPKQVVWDGRGSLTVIGGQSNKADPEVWHQAYRYILQQA